MRCSVHPLSSVLLGGRRSRSVTQRYLSSEFRDEALLWASRHTELAETSLKIPGFKSNTPPKDFHNFESYWEGRSWHFKDGALPHGPTLTTHTLSAPLTLLKGLNDVDSVCCVGARAESTLPIEFWKEYAQLRGPPRTTKLAFVGPDCLPRPRVAITTSAPIESVLELRWYGGVTLHQLLMKQPEGNVADSWQGYALFNPGLAHPNLTKLWKPTLKFLLKQGKPMLLTAHSEKDADRESSLFSQTYGCNVSYTLNPFASRISYHDPIDGAVVSPNQYVAVLTP